jgi:hypothetical protein
VESSLDGETGLCESAQKQSHAASALSHAYHPKKPRRQRRREERTLFVGLDSTRNILRRRCERRICESDSRAAAHFRVAAALARPRGELPPIRSVPVQASYHAAAVDGRRPCDCTLPQKEFDSRPHARASRASPTPRRLTSTPPCRKAPPIVLRMFVIVVDAVFRGRLTA